MIVHGHCRKVLENVADDVFDSCNCDPPYEIKFFNEEWDSRGVAFDPRVWREILRVMKPGAYLLAFTGPRTYHRITCAVEDAGFEIRDQIAWIYGEGMPKGGRPGPAIDKTLGAERVVVGHRTLSGTAALSTKERGGTHSVNVSSHGRKKVVPITTAGSEEAKLWEGWGYNLKPALEPIIVARKPFKGSAVSNILEHGVGALNVDACAVPVQGDVGEPRWPANVLLGHSPECLPNICVPWCPVAVLGAQSGIRKSAGNKSKTSGKGALWGSTGRRDWDPSEVSKNDIGTASRYFNRFYTADKDIYFPRTFYSKKVAPKERSVDGHVEISHRTIKPWKLMRWLVQLSTPPGGYVLDPFVGSGTTGIACEFLGMRFYGIDRKRGHVIEARARLKAAKQYWFSRAA